MGISLEDLIKNIEQLRKDMDYYLTCAGKTEDKKYWALEFLTLEGEIRSRYEND